MGIAALTLGIVSMVTWIIPPLGIPISVIGFILGIVALFVSKLQKGRAISGTVLCTISLILGIGVVVGLMTAGLVLQEVYPEYFR